MRSFLRWQRSVSNGRKPGRRLGRSTQARNLRVENLEQRALLSVTPSNLLFKDIGFTIAGGFSATTKVAGHTVPLSGNTSTSGDIQYTSPTAGQGSISVTGNITKPAAAATEFAMNGPLADANGKLSSTGLTLTEPAGNPGPYPSTGAFSPKTFVASTKIATLVTDSYTIDNAHWSGKVVQTTQTPFNVVVGDAGFDAGTLTVSVTVPGQAHSAVNESAAAATIGLEWAGTTGKPVGKAPKGDTISIAWNEASGTYTVSGLTPPTGATDIVLKTKFNGKVQHTTLVPLPLAAGNVSTSAALTAAAQSSQKKDAALGPQAVNLVLAMYA